MATRYNESNFVERKIVLVIVVALLVASSCRSQPAAHTETSSPESYQPGLGEIMTLQQMRHTKLWLAGQAKNWDLAAYELDELGEGFDDVLKFYPTHKDSPVAPKDAIPRMVNEPLVEVRTAVENKDAVAFESAYDKLTGGCNSCHDAMNFGFNKVQRPANNPYPNQVFTAAQK